ncbi:TPA: AbiH family protein [Streptococcus suis]|nr:bacteriophage abortive infection AbiH family protein [Streptococcus suis]
MNNKLFIIGNGFDLAHGLPTRFDPDFKEIAEKNEPDSSFWDLYQSEVADIWSDFENLLAKPNFNTLSDIFSAYYPDYYSDRESDRDGIILQADMSGNLQNSLDEFACQAEDALWDIEPKREFIEMFGEDDLFINFNYTHTLERVYGIEKERVLHVHGEVGANNLILGYPEGTYSPESIEIDVLQKGRGPYREVKLEDYLDSIEDYYISTAYHHLVDKIEGFQKVPNISAVNSFLDTRKIHEVIVYGHSCAIDFPYFDYLNQQYPFAKWLFYAFDDVTRWNIENMVSDIRIGDYEII